MLLYRLFFLHLPSSIFFPHVIASPTLTTLSRASWTTLFRVRFPQLEPTNEQNKWDSPSIRQSISTTVSNTVLYYFVHSPLLPILKIELPVVSAPVNCPGFRAVTATIFSLATTPDPSQESISEISNTPKYIPTVSTAYRYPASVTCLHRCCRYRAYR